MKNDGVQNLPGGEIELLADGGSTGQEGAKAIVPDLAAGEETEVSFSYVVPEDFNGDTLLSLHGTHGSMKSQGIYSGSSLDIESIHYEPINYAGDTSEARYQVTARIRNDGNAPSEDSTFVLSHIELKDDTVEEQPFGSCDIPSLEPQESYPITFEVSVGQEFFTGGEYRTAPVGAAVYKAYGTDGQRMECAMMDYLPVENVPEALMLNAEKSKRLGVSQKKGIMVQTEPANAKEFTNLTYESLDESIAVVDENGVVTGVKKGTGTVVVRAGGGLEARVKIQVEKDSVPDKKPSDSGVSGDDPGSGTPPSGEKKPGDGNEPAEKDKIGKGVKTGDNSDWYIWWLMLMTGAAAAGSVIYYKKRGKKA